MYLKNKKQMHLSKPNIFFEPMTKVGINAKKWVKPACRQSIKGLVCKKIKNINYRTR